MAAMTSHQIANKLLSLPDLPLVDEYAENIIVDVQQEAYETGAGDLDCIGYKTADFDTDDEEDPVMGPGE